MLAQKCRLFVCLSRILSLLFATPTNFSSLYDATVIIFMALKASYSPTFKIFPTVILAAFSSYRRLLRTFITIIFIIKFLFRISFLCVVLPFTENISNFLIWYESRAQKTLQNIWDDEHKTSLDSRQRVKKAELHMNTEAHNAKEWKNLLHLFLSALSSWLDSIPSQQQRV